MLTPKQRSYLSALAQSLQPVVMIGKNGLTDAVSQKLADEFLCRELLKIKFIDFKDEKKTIIESLAQKTGADVVRIIGNVGILFKVADDPKQRLIQLP